jgi:SecD/SecF fusion protein
MNIWVKSVLSGLAATALILFLLKSFIAPDKKIFSGQYILNVQPDDSAGTDVTSLLNNVGNIIVKRLRTAGFDHTINLANESSLDIRVTGIDDTLLVEEMLTANARIEFRELYTLDQFSQFFDSARKLKKYFPVSEQDTAAPAVDTDTISGELVKLSNSQVKIEPVRNLTSIIEFLPPTENADGRLSFSPAIGVIKKKDTALLNKILNDSALATERKDAKIYYGWDKTYYTSENTSDQLYLYMVRTKWRQKALLGNEDIGNVKARTNIDNIPEVNFQFTSEGSSKWEKMTGDNVGHPIAIIFNNNVVSAPQVLSPIANGAVTLSGGFTVDEAQELAVVLNSPSLPARITIAGQKISTESTSEPVLLAIIGAAAFLISGALAYFIFKMLKNR